MPATPPVKKGRGRPPKKQLKEEGQSKEEESEEEESEEEEQSEEEPNIGSFDFGIVFNHSLTLVKQLQRQKERTPWLLRRLHHPNQNLYRNIHHLLQPNQHRQPTRRFLPRKSCTTTTTLGLNNLA